MTSQTYFQAGTKVRGNYFGQSFAGTVREMRPHTIHPTRVEHFVDLDAPITVFGTERTSINVATCDANEPCSMTAA